MTRLATLLSEIGDNAKPLEWSLEDMQKDLLRFWIESQSKVVDGYDVYVTWEEDLELWEIAFKAEHEGVEFEYDEQSSTGEFFRIIKTLQQIIEWLGDRESWKHVAKDPQVKVLSFAPIDNQRDRVFDYIIRRSNFSNWEKDKQDGHWILTLK